MSEYNFTKVCKDKYYDKKTFGFKVQPIFRPDTVGNYCKVFVAKGGVLVDNFEVVNHKTIIYNRVVDVIKRMEENYGIPD